MKQQMMKYTRRLRWRSRLIVVPAAMLFFVLSAQAQTDQILPPIGGDGGNQFVGRCPQGELLAGFELRTGDYVDAIRPLCVAAYGPRETSAAPLTTGSGLITKYKSPLGSTFDIVELESGWYGGTGGGLRNVICPKDTPIVTGMYVYSAGREIESVISIHLFCGVAATTQTLTQFPAGGFDGHAPQAPVFSTGFGASSSDTQLCSTGGLVAVGISGKSGKWLDSLGLICGPPKLTTIIKAGGRVPAGTTPNPPRSICESAREARARNSPAAPGLEAQCLAAGAAGEKPVIKAEGRVTLPAGTAPNPPRSICESARETRARNNPAAPGLEESCRAALAAKGAAIANEDPVVAEARNAEPDALYRQGFDIATAIFGNPALGAQGNTQTGPGSLGIRNTLNAAGQRGFDASVKLHLSRKYER
jgi:hypothetical protein